MTINALIDQLGIVADEGLNLDNAPLVIKTETTRVERGQWVKGQETVTINGKAHTFLTRYRFTDPALTSIQFRVTDTEKYHNRQDFSATAVSHRDLEIWASDTWVPLQDVLLSIYNALGGGSHSEEKLKTRLDGYGLDLTAINPMYLQQLGASREKYDAIVEEFVALGAEPAKPRASSKSTKTTIVSLYRLNGGGVPVEYLELGTADRAMSQSATPSGFIGFLDATVSAFNTVMSLDLTRSALERDESPEAQIALANLVGMFASPTDSRPFRNWGGLSVVTDILDDDVVEYYPQQVPCGRFGVVIGGEVKTWDVWSEKQDGQTVAAPEPAESPAETLANALNAE